MEKVLQKIKPTAQEKEAVMKEIDDLLSQITVPGAELILGGSISKDTWLKDTTDVDVFVAFNQDNGALADTLAPYLEQFNPERVHGSRDYFRFHYGQHDYEFIPILRIDDAREARNITDISPLHTRWVTAHTDEKIKDEIRLAKRFLQAHYLYGAESFIQGLSGYVTEILVIVSGGFVEFLQNVTKWPYQHVVDPESYHKDVFFEVNNSKLTSPLIVIDPVQKGRNAAAALSDKQYEKLKEIAKAYLKHPSAGFFEYEELDLSKTNTICVTLTPFEGKRDVVGCQLRKAYEAVARLLENHDFEIVESGWQWNEKAVCYYVLQQYELLESKEICGPPLSMPTHVESFKAKYGEAYEKDGRICAVVQRDIRKPSELAEKITKIGKTYAEEVSHSL